MKKTTISFISAWCFILALAVITLNYIPMSMKPLRFIKRFKHSLTVNPKESDTTKNESGFNEHLTSSLCSDKEPNNKGKKVLAYALFGVRSWKSYGSHVISVAEEADKSHLYSQWYVRIYHDGQTELSLERQKEYKKKFPNLFFCNVEQLNIPSIPFSNFKEVNGMVWRFLPLVDETVDIACGRDLDSPLISREEQAVLAWMNTSKIFHVMRDHPQHNSAIMGGLWCFRCGVNRSLAKDILKIVLFNVKRRNNGIEVARWDDQNILNWLVWPLIKSDTLHHDSYLCKNYPGSSPFPEKRSSKNCVGCYRNYNSTIIEKCPTECRPINHKDWDYC